MDGNGGCCIARYAGGVYDLSKIDRIMLRFRPIAPKPAVGGSVSEGTHTEKSEILSRNGRAKRRRYVRDNKKKSCSRKRKVVSEERTDVLSEAFVTLPLLPEKPDPKDTRATGSASDLDRTVGTNQVMYLPNWMNHQFGGSGASDRTVVMPQPVRPVGSCVIVEYCAMDACTDGKRLGSTDEEKIRNLVGDTCPGFISDGVNKVKWTNEAYRKMVNQDGEGEARPEMVWLVVKENMPVTCPAFACRVRLQYTCKKEKNSLTVPCDVWRMDCGGFAWRLDVNAALSLGR